MSMVIDGTSGLTFNNATTQNSGGKVLQVVNATGTSILSTTSGTAVTTGFSATITPLFNTSKILVQFYGRCFVSITGNEGSVYIYRGASSIQGGYTTYSAAGATAAQQSIIVLDSPATTSATTYTIYFKVSGGTLSINPNGAIDGAYGLLLTEIAA